MTDISGICPKCKANVGFLLRDLAHGECAYCTTRSSSITEEQAKELIELGEKAITTNPPEDEAEKEFEVRYPEEAFKKILLEAERRGEERGWAARDEQIRVEGIPSFLKQGWKRKWETISDWRNSEEYKEGKW